MKKHTGLLLLAAFFAIISLLLVFADPSADEPLAFIAYTIAALIAMVGMTTCALIGLVELGHHRLRENTKGQSLVTSHYCGGMH